MRVSIFIQGVAPPTVPGACQDGAAEDPAGNCPQWVAEALLAWNFDSGK
ncbi:MAG TPA: hypothetical protein PLU47_17895 [Azonexus sp.]|nr:hypothetical protein [Azonexus sp.]